MTLSAITAGVAIGICAAISGASFKSGAWRWALASAAMSLAYYAGTQGF